ncbi:MerR family transcriptional regulator [Microbacterium sp. DT81.1]|uniref:MerR family transcriptional regulator n=1 Tax=Microbacterium sp. DT81.1 TaxID=3393413 RepID=UPI003CF75585
MTTAALGRLVGYSSQQVRDLERLGVIPTAVRGANGYRLYEQRHIIALGTYRALAAAIGPVPARQLLPTLLASTLDEAAEMIDELHAAIARDRARVREARRGVDTVLTEAADAFDEHDAMTIGELAQALDVRPSALRHWEHEGLVSPDRITGSQARRYDARAITEARMVAALRSGGSPIPPIARILSQLRETGLTMEARALLDERLADLSRRSIALLEAASHLHALLVAREPSRPPVIR